MHKKIIKLEDKLIYLSKITTVLKDLPNPPNAILVFGSPRLETPHKVIELINKHSDWKDVPVIVSGKGKDERITEAEKKIQQ